MSENETWRDDTSSEDSANRESKNESGYNSSSNDEWNERRTFNRAGSYNREGGQSFNSYESRPKRPRFTRDAGSGSGEPMRYNRYDQQRPSYGRDANGEQSGGYRPRFNQNGDQGQGGGYNRFGGERPQRPAYNRYDNNNSQERRPYNPNRTWNNDGNTQERKPWRPQGQSSWGSNQQQERRPWGSQERKPWNSQENAEGGDDQQQRPRFNRPNNYGNQQSGGYGNHQGGGYQSGGYRSNNYDNQGGGGYGNRPQRPRFNQGGGGGYGNRPQRPGGGFRPGGGGGFNRNGARPQRPAYNPNKIPVVYKDIVYDPEELIRLNKYLANAGVCSRREADEFIQAGVVTVNGAVVTELGTKIKRSDEVKFHDNPVSTERKIYVLLNKPKNCVTTSDDPQARTTVMDLVKGACQERIYPVGRLDRNTTGVLLLTNDGDLASKLTHPKFLKKKIYQLATDKPVTPEDIDKIKEGIQLDEETLIKADDISYIDPVKPNQLGIEIHSGQNRIVRRIFETLGYKVIRLDRVYFAGLTKKGLKRGDWRYLTESEVNYLRMGSFT
jgi:23S rRNA pseudouridine2605 synthase